MLNSLGLGFIFTAQDLASGRIERLERTFLRLSSSVGIGTEVMRARFKSLAFGIGTLVAGTATLGGVFVAASAAGAFEQKIASVGAVSRASSDQLRALHDAAIQVGIATQFSPTEAAEGLQTLATAGQTVEQSIRTLLPVLDLAAGSLGQITVDQAADAVVGTLNAYSMGAEQAATVTDKLLRTTLLTNLQARDFEAGLAKAAATGALFHQSLDDVLVTLGLLRNRNIDASSSATAYREAVRRLGSDAHAQAAVEELRVDIFDRSTGAMRSLLDVMDDISRATQSMTEEERNRIVVQAFGARGLMAFQAVEKAQFTTTREGIDVTLQGRDAILALRGEMEKASGSAAYFRDALLNTFEGQKTLLRGTLQTYAIVLGEPFAQVLKPFLGALLSILNGVLDAFRQVPDPVKRVFAGLVVAAGAAVTLVGALLTAKAAFALGTVALQVLGLSLGGIVGALLPAVAVVGALAVAFAGLRAAVRLDLGGVGSRFRALYEAVALAYRGVMQLLGSGALSGAVQRELNTLDSAPLKAFVIAVYQLVFRLSRVGEGIRGGFLAGIAELEPVLDDLRLALHALSDAFGALVGEALGDATALPSDRFVAFGAAVGKAASFVVGALVRLVTVGTQLYTGLLQGWEGALRPLRFTLAYVTTGFEELGLAWEALTGQSLGPSADGTAGWRTLGYVLTRVVGGALALVLGLFGALVRSLVDILRLVEGARNTFVALGETLRDVALAVVEFFTDTVPNAIEGLVDAIVAPVERIFQSVPDRLVPDVVARTTAATGAPVSMPALAEARARVTELREITRERTLASATASAPTPVTVQLQIDGETLARVTADANTRAARRSFVPLPAV